MVLHQYPFYQLIFQVCGHFKHNMQSSLKSGWEVGQTFLMLTKKMVISQKCLKSDSKKPALLSQTLPGAE